MKALRTVSLNFYLIFFLLSFLQTRSIDLRLIPVLKITLFCYSLTYIPQYLKSLNNSKGIYHVGNISLLLYISYFILSIFSYLDYNKNIRFYIEGIILYIVPLCSFFWSVCIKEKEANLLYRKIEYALVICCITGLYLYFMAPSWYINWRLSSYADWVGIDNAERIFLSYNNLSSVFTHPYFVAYTSVFLVSLYLNRLYKNQNIYINLILLIIVLVTIILAQQRVVIAFSICLILIYSLQGIRKKILIFYVLITIIFSVICFLFIHYSNEIQYLIERYNTIITGDVFNDGRANIAKHLLETDFNYVLGEGANLVGHIAISFGKPCIADSEYLKFIYELGVVGTTIFYAFTSLTIYVAYKYKSYIELPVVIFFIIAMYGANPFEKDNIILLYWICSGRVWYNTRNYFKSNKYENRICNITL